VETVGKSPKEYLGGGTAQYHGSNWKLLDYSVVGFITALTELKHEDSKPERDS
jgi:hypothetical protein